MNWFDCPQGSRAAAGFAPEGAGPQWVTPSPPLPARVSQTVLLNICTWACLGTGSEGEHRQCGQSVTLVLSPCFQMFLTVYLSNNEQHFTEVPVTPETICRDVVDLCKEPGESDCHLAEVWCGSGGRAGQPVLGYASLMAPAGRGGGCSRFPTEELESSVSVRRYVPSSFAVT